MSWLVGGPFQVVFATLNEAITDPWEGRPTRNQHLRIAMKTKLFVLVALMLGNSVHAEFRERKGVRTL